MTLSQLTYRAQEQDFAAVAEILDLSVEDVEFCYDCVGNTERKGCILVGEEMITVTHFTHQCRVAFHVQNSFPEDLWSRRLALFHDCKEEAVEGKELKYKELGDIAQWIDILTEIKPSDQEAEEFDQQLPEGNWDAKWILKYRNYITLLHTHWAVIGRLELCDRYDGATFEYMKAEKYMQRMPHKSIEAFARVYATIEVSDHALVEKTKERCRTYFDAFGVTEKEVQEFEKYFLE